MKQLNFLNSESETVTPITHWHLYVDGAARNNPGPAGAGICLIKNGKTDVKKGFFLGNKTNNQAEYLALLIGIYTAQSVVGKDDHLAIFADSQLLVRQMNGEYKVKDAQLKLLQNLAFHLLMPYDYTLQHVPREQNAHADEMANNGIDKKIKLPQEFLVLLQKHEIHI